MWTKLLAGCVRCSIQVIYRTLCVMVTPISTEISACHHNYQRHAHVFMWKLPSVTPGGRTALSVIHPWNEFSSIKTRAQKKSQCVESHTCRCEFFLHPLAACDFASMNVMVGACHTYRCAAVWRVLLIVAMVCIDPLQPNVLTIMNKGLSLSLSCLKTMLTKPEPKYSKAHKLRLVYDYRCVVQETPQTVVDWLLHRIDALNTFVVYSLTQSSIWRSSKGGIASLDFNLKQMDHCQQNVQFNYFCGTLVRYWVHMYGTEKEILSTKMCRKISREMK